MLDDIDRWAEKTFKRSQENRRIMLRNGMAKIEGQRKFNSLFKREVTHVVQARS